MCIRDRPKAIEAVQAVVERVAKEYIASPWRSNRDMVEALVGARSAEWEKQYLAWLEESEKTHRWKLSKKRVRTYIKV